MENSASSDAIVREKIARLPPDVSEVVHLEKLKSAKEGAELMEKVIIYTFLLQHVPKKGCSHEIQIQNYLLQWTVIDIFKGIGFISLN